MSVVGLGAFNVLFYILNHLKLVNSIPELSDSVKNFIDTRSFNFFYLILLPTGIYKTATLIDNISNSTSLEDMESGNAASTFSDHLPQIIFLNFFSQ